MKKELLIVGALLLPVAAARADVKINVKVSGGNSCTYEKHVERDDDYDEEIYYNEEVESWYEDCDRSGPYESRIEWNWVFSSSGNRILRFRRASFHTVHGSWSYSPWSVKVTLRDDDYRNECRVRHHKKVYRHHKKVYRHHPRKVTVVRYYDRHDRHDRYEHKNRYKKEHNYRDERSGNNHGKYYSERPAASQPTVRRPEIRNVPHSAQSQGTLKKQRYLEDAPTHEESNNAPVKISSGRVRVW